eukprot:243550_1
MPNENRIVRIMCPSFVSKPYDQHGNFQHAQCYCCTCFLMLPLSLLWAAWIFPIWMTSTTNFELTLVYIGWIIIISCVIGLLCYVRFHSSRDCRLISRVLTFCFAWYSCCLLYISVDTLHMYCYQGIYLTNISDTSEEVPYDDIIDSDCHGYYGNIFLLIMGMICSCLMLLLGVICTSKRSTRATSGLSSRRNPRHNSRPISYRVVRSSDEHEDEDEDDNDQI